MMKSYLLFALIPLCLWAAKAPLKVEKLEYDGLASRNFLHESKGGPLESVHMQAVDGKITLFMLGSTSFQITEGSFVDKSSFKYGWKAPGKPELLVESLAMPGHYSYLQWGIVRQGPESKPEQVRLMVLGNKTETKQVAQLSDAATALTFAGDAYYGWLDSDSGSVVYETGAVRLALGPSPQAWTGSITFKNGVVRELRIDSREAVQQLEGKIVDGNLPKGTFHCSFFGPHADEIGGVFFYKDGDLSYNGVFALARRHPEKHQQ